MQDSPFLTYAIFAHKNPGQVRKLIEKLQDGYCTFLVHVDRSVSIREFRQELAALEQVSFTRKRYRSYWGSYQFAEAKINLLREWCTSAPTLDRIVFLSGQDYPLVSNQVLRRFWEENRLQSFIIYKSLEAQHLRHHQERYDRYYFFPKRGLILKYPSESKSPLHSFKDWMLKSSGRFPLPKAPPLPLYFGSNWLRLTRLATTYFLTQFDANPGIRRYFLKSLLPEEVLFHTVLANGSEQERGPLVNTDLTYTYWDEPLGRYPNPLTDQDFDTLMRSKYLYARKFDSDLSKSLLRRIDSATG